MMMSTGLRGGIPRIPGDPPGDPIPTMHGIRVAGVLHPRLTDNGPLTEIKNMM